MHCDGRILVEGGIDDGTAGSFISSIFESSRDSTRSPQAGVYHRRRVRSYLEAEGTGAPPALHAGGSHQNHSKWV